MRVLLNRSILFLSGLFLSSVGAFAAPAVPSIASLLKPEALKKVTQDREIVTHASLVDSGQRIRLKRYSFFAVMWVDAELSTTRRILTDYTLYPKMIPYIDEANYMASSHLLRLRGGIWRWRLSSILKFDEKSQNWIHFDIVSGHFQGMVGDFFFERAPIKGTWVYMRGELSGTRWPPAFIVERGAEIVFEFTAKRMRSYIEDSARVSPGNAPYGGIHDREVPKPRSHL